jgi:hypothetical protein
MVHYLIHKRPPPDRVLRQNSLIHTSRTHFLKIHFNIILPSTSSSLVSPHQNRVCTSSVLHTCHMPRLSHTSWFYNSNDILWAVQCIKLLNMWSSSLSCHFILFRPKYPPHCPPKHSTDTRWIFCVDVFLCIMRGLCIKLCCYRFCLLNSRFIIIIIIIICRKLKN